MSIEHDGPVTSVEVSDLVSRVQDMASRASQNGQGAYYFVLATAAESMADNFENAAALEADDDA